MTLKEKKICKTKRYLQRKILLKVPQRNILVTMQEQITVKDSMTKLLNSWNMAKRIQSNCKIYVKTFFGATVLCMDDYMKLSGRNPPDHIIFHVWTNDLSSEKSSMEIAKSIINLSCQRKNEMLDVSV